MRPLRLIARLDIKGSRLIKGVHLEGLRVVGDPQEHARRYYEAGADEILYMDAVASLYGRNSLSAIVEETARDVFIPMTVGGGIRSVEDAAHLLRSGADKIAVNTAAIARPALITEISERFGAQCVVLSVEAKRVADGRWEAYTDGGREHSGRDAVGWCREAVEKGAGEILLTSIDQEGTGKGFDVALVRAVSSRVEVPVIACGGMGRYSHLTEAVSAGADAVAMAQALHWNKLSLAEVRRGALSDGLAVRST